MEAKLDLEAVQRVQGILKNATISGGDAPLVGALLQYLAALENIIHTNVVKAEADEKQKAKQEQHNTPTAKRTKPKGKAGR